MVKIIIQVEGAAQPLEFEATSQDQRRFLAAYEKHRAGGGDAAGKFPFREGPDGGVVRTLHLDLGKVLWVVVEEEMAPRKSVPSASGRKK